MPYLNLLSQLSPHRTCYAFDSTTEAAGIGSANLQFPDCHQHFVRRMDVADKIILCDVDLRDCLRVGSDLVDNVFQRRAELFRPWHFQVHQSLMMVDK